MNKHLEADKNELNFSFEEVNVGPVKVSYGKRKVSQLQHKLKEKHSRIQKKIANVLNVAPEEIECSEQENAISEEMKKKARDLDRIVELMKDQIQISPRKTKIQVLTMTHSSWSVRKTAEVFDVSNYIVRKAFRLREEKCILATPEAKKGSVLTSHGKSPCDGIGGTVKRLVARASLQRPYDKQLLPAREVFTFCKEEIKVIEFIFISQADMEITRTTLELRYTNAKTVSGTRSFHHFVPLSASCIGTKRISKDQNYALHFNFLSTPASEPIVISVNSFVVCLYDDENWIGLIEEVDNDQRDAKIRFMHPKCIARSYFWPVKDDTCWVPDENIICNIGVPTTVTGRQYKLQPKDQEVLRAFIDKQ